MANILEIILKAIAQGSGFKDTKKDAADLDKAMGSLNKVLGMAGLAVGAKELIDFGKASVDAALESATAEAALMTALQSTGQASAEYKAQLDALATSLENTTMFTDEQVMAAEASLVTFRNLGQDIMPQVITTVADMGQKMGDLGAAAQLAGIVLNAPAQAAARLQRQGIMLTETQKEQIATMVEMGNTAGAQSILLDVLNVKFGGQATAAREAAGGMQDWAVSTGRLHEEFGKLILAIGESGVGGAATGLVDTLTEGSTVWAGNVEQIQLFTDALNRANAELSNTGAALAPAKAELSEWEKAQKGNEIILLMLANAAIESTVGWDALAESYGEIAQEATDAAAAQAEIAAATAEAAAAAEKEAAFLDNVTTSLDAMGFSAVGAAEAHDPLVRGMIAASQIARDEAQAVRELAAAHQANLAQMAQESQANQNLLAAKEAAPELGARITEQRQAVFDIQQKQEEEAAAESEKNFKASTAAMVEATKELGNEIASAVSGAVSQSGADIAKLLGLGPEGEARVNEDVRRMAAVATGGLANEWTQQLATQLQGVDAAQAFVNAVGGGDNAAVMEEARKLAINPVVELFDVMAMANGVEQKMRGEDLAGQLNQRIQKILSEKGLDASIDAISQVAQGTQAVATQAGTSVDSIGVSSEAAGERVKTAFADALPAIDTLSARISLLIGLIERVGVVAVASAGAVAGLNPPEVGAGAGLVPNGAQRRMGGMTPQ